jgi:uncharacterized protein YkwD
VLRRLLLLGVFLPASVHADAGGEPLPCQDDPALSAAAAELLLSEDAVDSQGLTRALRAAGSDAVAVRALLWRGDSSTQVRSWLSDFAAGADAPMTCGIAHGASKHLLLAAARGGALQPVDARSHTIKGKLEPSFKAAELVIADARGGLQRFAVDAKQLAHGVRLDDDLPRPAQIQLVARGRRGPRPLAERVLPADDASARDDLSGATEAPAVEPRMSPEPHSGLQAAELLTELRREQGRPDLRDNALLEKVAAEHAKRVCASGVIAHELERGKNPEERLRNAGIQARRVGETVARSADTESAFAAFERSPSHRLTLLERGFTDVGIGDSIDAEHRHCVVVLLAEWPRYVGR